MRNDTVYNSPYCRPSREGRAFSRSRTGLLPLAGRVLDVLVRLVLGLMLLVSLAAFAREFPYSDVSLETLKAYACTESTAMGLYFLSVWFVFRLLYRYARRKLAEAYGRNGALGVAWCLVVLAFKLVFLGLVALWALVRIMLEAFATHHQAPRMDSAEEHYRWMMASGKCDNINELWY